MISRIFSPLVPYKWFFLLLLAAAVGSHIYILNIYLAAEQEKNERLNNQLIDSLAAEAILTTTLNDTQNSLDIVSQQLAKRDKLALKAQQKSKELNNIINVYQEQLEQLKEENEQYKVWSIQPVPDVINGLLGDTRNKIQNSSKN